MCTLARAYWAIWTFRFALADPRVIFASSPGWPELLRDVHPHAVSQSLLAAPWESRRLPHYHMGLFRFGSQILERFIAGVVTREYDGTENEAIAANVRWLGPIQGGGSCRTWRLKI
jgi:hypothetical protein